MIETQNHQTTTREPKHTCLDYVSGSKQLYDKNTILFHPFLIMILTTLMTAINVIPAPSLWAQGSQSLKRFSEMVIVFDSQRKIHFAEDRTDNAVILEFKNTAPHELSAFDRYDETVIRRLLMKDHGPEGTEVKIYLRDPGLKVTVDILNEPFRLSMSIFDPGYQHQTDPKTGLPLAGSFTQGLPVDQNQYVSQPHDLGKIRSLSEPSEIAFAEKQPLLPPETLTGNELNSTSQRKLLQPPPGKIQTSTEFSQLIQETPDGRGDYWNEYPYYIYPTQTAAYEGRSKPSGWSKKSHQLSPSDTQRMAEFAYKMYSFGNEKKALVAYQQVLHREPSVFDKDILHLWAFAESHLGHGNLSLADGYFDAIVSKFPDSPLSKLAYIRRLDIQSIKFLRNKKPENLEELTKPLAHMNASASGEISAQRAIRMAYWISPLPSNFQTELPLTSSQVIKELEANLQNTESKKTSFLSHSIILKQFLHPSSPWTDAGGYMASDWLSRYTDGPANPFYQSMKNELKEKLSTVLIKKSMDGQFQETVAIWQALPPSITEVRSEPKVSWAVGEAFRNSNLNENALPFYGIASQAAEQAPMQFKAMFWHSTLSGRVSEDYRGQNKKQNQYVSQSKVSDKKSYRIWKNLKQDEKNSLRTTYKKHMEDTLDDSVPLTTPSLILLENWEAALGESRDQDNQEIVTNYSPGADVVHLLQKLIQRFRKAGLSDERRRATRLLKEIKPESYLNDKTAQSIWTRELSALANEYRSSGDYLKAGRLFTFTAENSVEWNNRAESLYKGGLLLYRAGKREEAITALTKASQDGNNLFYANLAKERLTQLLP